MWFLLPEMTTASINIDNLSKYIEMKCLNIITASVISVINATHGIKITYRWWKETFYLWFDVEFFFQEWGIKHHITPPDFPRENEQIKRVVQTIMISLSEAAEEGTGLYIVLLDYRIQLVSDMALPT